MLKVCFESSFLNGLCHEMNTFFEDPITINVPVVYMGRYKVVLRGEYP